MPLWRVSSCPSILLFGISFGFFAGISPGPLSFLIITETLRGGFKRGAAISFAPILTDGPIIILGFFLLHFLSGGGYFFLFLSVISFAGALFLLYLTAGILFFPAAHSTSPETSETGPPSLLKGIMVNFLSPHPYLFWFTIGIPAMMKTGLIACRLGFAAAFFIIIIAIKIALAYSVAKGSRHLGGRIGWATKGLTVFFLYFIFLLVKDGIFYWNKFSP